MYLIFDSVEQVSSFTAQRIFNKIVEKPKAVLGLATGGTMEPVYQELITLLKANNSNLSQLTTFNLDEYVGLSPTHEQSYNYYMHHHLFDHIEINDVQVHLPNGVAADLNIESKNYSQAILEAGGLDLQLLGVGGNGHIGFNEPNTAFNTPTHVVELSKQTRIDNARFFTQLDEVPTHAITMGMKDILQAKEILFVATGVHKAEIVQAIYAIEPTELIPASAIKNHPNAIIVLDSAAASLLPETAQQHARVNAQML